METKSDFPMKFGNPGTNLIKFILVPKSLRVFPLLLQFIIKEFHGIHLGLLGNLHRNEFLQAGEETYLLLLWHDFHGLVRIIRITH